VKGYLMLEKLSMITKIKLSVQTSSIQSTWISSAAIPVDPSVKLQIKKPFS
jgi:hypothetical protein